MKIAMVSMCAGPLARLGDVEAGGQSVAVDCLSRALARLGHEVTIFTRLDDRTRPPCLTTADGVHVHHLAGAGFAASLGAQWSAAPPGVVHAHGWTSGQAALEPARTLGLPVVQTFYGLAAAAPPTGDTGALAARIAAEAVLARECARLIASCSAEVFALLRMGANPGTIKLVPCGVDLELFAWQPRRAARAGRPFRIATLGRLVPDAGVADVIAALAYVEDIELAVGGGPADLASDPDACGLAQAVRAGGLGDRVSMHGRIGRDDAAPFLRAADALVCVPHNDATGAVALEAMACGVPVIASTVGPLVDIVVDGLTGIHVPPRAPRQLAYALAALKDDPDRCERFGRFGVERANVRYGWPRLAAETLEVYGSVAGRARATMRG